MFSEASVLQFTWEGVSLWTEKPFWLDLPPVDKDPWTEIPLLWTETPPTLDSDPSTETPSLDRDSPGQRPPYSEL